MNQSKIKMNINYLSWNQAIWLIWSALNGNWDFMNIATIIFLHSGVCCALGWIVSECLLVAVWQFFVCFLYGFSFVSVFTFWFNIFSTVNNFVEQEKKNERKRYRQCYLNNTFDSILANFMLFNVQLVDGEITPQTLDGCVSIHLCLLQNKYIHVNRLLVIAAWKWDEVNYLFVVVVNV